MVSQAEKQHCQRVALRLVECGQEIGSAHHRQGSPVAHHADEVDHGRHHAPEDRHLHGEVLVHFLEQPVKSQYEEDQDHGADQVGCDAEAEEQLVSGDVVDSGGRVPGDKQLVGNVDQAQRAEDGEGQVPNPGDSPGVAGRAHVEGLM
jgi:hypothetical protein